MSAKLALWPLRKRVYDVLDGGTDHQIHTDATSTDFPYVAIGPVTVSEASTDSASGQTYAVQVDVYADLADGGGMTANKILTDCLTALDAASYDLDGFDALPLGLGTASVTEEYDREVQRQLAHGFATFTFSIHSIN